MTPEKLKGAIEAVNEVDAIGTSTFAKCIARDYGFLIVGIVIEMDEGLTEQERDKAREHLLELRGGYLDSINTD
ncbi:MAG: hypothetical protein AAB622_00300 [Patescibacteria group bacterium]